jgi:hypothetical protein
MRSPVLFFVRKRPAHPNFYFDVNNATQSVAPFNLF